MLNTTPSMDFTSILPKEVCKAIFKKVPFDDWQNIAKVSSKWLEILPEASLPLFKCLPLLKKLVLKCEEESYRYQIITDIVKIQAEWSRKAAKEFAKQIPDQFLEDSNMHKAAALGYIAKAKRNLQKAKTAVLQLEYPGAKNRSLLSILEKELFLNCTEDAKATADLIDSENMQAKAFIKLAGFDGSYLPKLRQMHAIGVSQLEIVQIAATIDMQQAKEIAAQIKTPSDYVSALIEIAKVDPYVDVAELKKIILTSENTSLSKIAFLIEVAKIDAGDNLAEAKQLASQTTHLKMKVWEWIRIAEQDPQHDFLEAKQAAQQIANEKDQEEAFCQIATHEAPFHFSNAQVLLGEVQSPHKRAGLLQTLACSIASYSLEEAKNLARQIEGEEMRARGFLNIAKINPSYALEEVKAFIAGLTDIELKCTWLWKVAKFYSGRAKKQS